MHEGFLYRTQDRLDEAEQMFMRALAGYEKALGPEHTSTLDTVYNLGDLYRAQGQAGRGRANVYACSKSKDKIMSSSSPMHRRAFP